MLRNAKYIDKIFIYKEEEGEEEVKEVYVPIMILTLNIPTRPVQTKTNRNICDQLIEIALYVTYIQKVLI
jgi:hypothetical protein